MSDLDTLKGCVSMGLFSFLFRRKSKRDDRAGTSMPPEETEDTAEALQSPSECACRFRSSYIIIDTETTGLNPYSDKIIQLSAIKYDTNGRPIDSFSTYINPGRPIPPSATKINGITDKMVLHAPFAEQICDKFLSFLGDSLLVGYNVTFDLRFLEQTFQSFSGRSYVDVLTIARQRLTLPNYKLETVASSFAFQPKTAFHDALTDCEAVALILCCVAEDLSDWTKVFQPSLPHSHQFESTNRFSSWSSFDNNGDEYDDEDEGDEGFEYWRLGERERKVGQFEKALELFDKARAAGYDCPVLYSSYAMIYRKCKDYEKEIAISEEAIAHLDAFHADHFRYRKERASQLLLASQQKEALAQQKEQERAVKVAERQRKKEEAAAKPKQPCGRPIMQCSDDGTVIKIFESVAAAAAEAGVSTKCIRDAANGRQKHAGGFCWKYAAPVGISDKEQV